MGDPDAPRDFAVAHQVGIDNWSDSLGDLGGSEVVATSAVAGSVWSCQISRTIFVDDIAATSPPAESALPIVTWIQEAPRRLAQATAPSGGRGNLWQLEQSQSRT